MPSVPVSHGCVRVSNEAINWIWAANSDPIGTEVWVYSYSARLATPPARILGPARRCDNGAMTSREIASASSPPDGHVAVPGSKSIANRAMLAAALAEGTSQLTRILVADDVEAMFDCVDALGATVDVEGHDGHASPASAGSSASGVAFARQSGTTARFHRAGPRADDRDRGGSTAIRSCGRGRWTTSSTRCAASARRSPRRGGQSLPVDDHRAAPRRGGRRSSGSTSSQFLSGLLLAAPLR